MEFTAAVQMKHLLNLTASTARRLLIYHSFLKRSRLLRPFLPLSLSLPALPFHSLLIIFNTPGLPSCSALSSLHPSWLWGVCVSLTHTYIYIMIIGGRVTSAAVLVTYVRCLFHVLSKSNIYINDYIGMNGKNDETRSISRRACVFINDTRSNSP